MCDKPLYGFGEHSEGGHVDPRPHLVSVGGHLKKKLFFLVGGAVVTYCPTTKSKKNSLQIL